MKRILSLIAASVVLFGCSDRSDFEIDVCETENANPSNIRSVKEVTRLAQMALSSTDVSSRNGENEKMYLLFM